MPTKSKDDLILTISDDEIAVDDTKMDSSDDDEEEVGERSLQPTAKSRAVLNPEFSFMNDSSIITPGGSSSSAGGWDFKSAASQEQTRKQTTLFVKVEAQRQAMVDAGREIANSDDEIDEDAADEAANAERKLARKGGKVPSEGAVDIIVEDEDEEMDEAAMLEEEERSRRRAEFFDMEPAIDGSLITPSDDAMTFQKLHLSRPLLRAITELGYVHPTPVQARCIPKILQGKDMCAGAQTGSGKTAAFLLPTLERLLFRSKRMASTRVLIITPTRELAAQCHQMCLKLAQFTDIKASLVVGGLSIKTQEIDLRTKPDILICTPGRMIDHVRNAHGIDLDSVEILILDEADKLLEMGFTDEVHELVKFCPIGRQTLLFSATMTDEVDQLVKLSLNKPVRIRVNAADHVADRLTQEFIRIRETRENTREAIILALVTRSFKKEVIIFCESKKEAHRMTVIFGLVGLKAAELHGNMTQKQRLDALQDFRDKKVDFLLATELAARGLDVQGVSTVINSQMPRELSRYIHRVGRTARAGRSGRAITLVGEKGRPMLKEIIKNAESNVKSRSVPVDITIKWQKRIDSLEDDIEEVYRAEAEEKEMRVAEMEAQRLGNIMVHEDEIKSRPARTWFQSQTEKEATKKAAREAAGIEDEDEDGKKGPKGGEMLKEPREKREHKLSRKKRRRIAALGGGDSDGEGDGDDDEENPAPKKKAKVDEKEAGAKLQKSLIAQKQSIKAIKREAIKAKGEGRDIFKEQAKAERRKKRQEKEKQRQKSLFAEEMRTGGAGAASAGTAALAKTKRKEAQVENAKKFDSKGLDIKKKPKKLTRHVKRK